MKNKINKNILANFIVLLLFIFCAIISIEIGIYINKHNPIKNRKSNTNIILFKR